MVTRVYGLANGTKVIFSHGQGNQWEITVPWTEDGKYTAEIFAEDEAGNLSHLCTMLFVISGHELQACIVLEEKQASVKDDKKYQVEISKNYFSAELKEKDYQAGIFEKTYSLELQERGYQVECVVCSNSGI